MCRRCHSWRRQVPGLSRHLRTTRQPQHPTTVISALPRFSFQPPPECALCFTPHAPFPCAPAPQVSNLCQSIAISQNVYPFPAEFIPPPDPFFQPYSARCTCGLSSIVIDDGVYQMASSLGIGDLRDPPAPK